jgi:hypothetical protein
MHCHEATVLAMLSGGQGSRTLLGSSGAVKERIRRVRAAASPVAESCGGVGGGWGNSPIEPVAESCGGSGGGWGNSPEVN